MNWILLERRKKLRELFAAKNLDSALLRGVENLKQLLSSNNLDLDLLLLLGNWSLDS